MLAIHIIKIRFDDVMVRRRPVNSVVGHVARNRGERSVLNLKL